MSKHHQHEFLTLWNLTCPLMFGFGHDYKMNRHFSRVFFPIPTCWFESVSSSAFSSLPFVQVKHCKHSIQPNVVLHLNDAIEMLPEEWLSFISFVINKRFLSSRQNHVDHRSESLWFLAKFFAKFFEIFFWFNVKCLKDFDTMMGQFSTEFEESEALIEHFLGGTQIWNGRISNKFTSKFTLL